MVRAGPETYGLIRQTKITHQGGYSREELLDFRWSIWRYLLETARRIVEGLRISGQEPPIENANTASCELILNHRTDVDHPGFVFQPKFAEAVQELWKDDTVPLAGLLSNFSLPDNAA